MENALDIAEKLIGIKYTLWLGDHQNTDDNPEPFYINEIPNIEYIKQHGINCAGLINIMRLKCSGNIPGEGSWRGGTESWYNYLKSKNALIEFDYKSNYPIGTLLLRTYRNPNEQGHLAVIYDKDKNDIYLNDTIIHSYNDKSGGKVDKCYLGFSHYSIPGGYYEYAILPDKWLFN